MIDGPEQPAGARGGAELECKKQFLGIGARYGIQVVFVDRRTLYGGVSTRRQFFFSQRSRADR